MNLPVDRARAALEGYARRTFGLVFPTSRAQGLDRAIERACAALGLPDGDALLPRLQRGDAAAVRAFGEALTVRETYFFRDATHFDLVRAHLLAITRADPERTVQLWSAGCATGEEAWSLAIVARDALGVKGLARVRVYGTDLDAGAIEQARRGRYRSWSFRAGYTPDPRWFEADATGWRVTASLRGAVTFFPLNLMDDAAAGPRDVDVILCRNVLIYFDLAGVATVAQRLARALAPDGRLVMGPSDPSLAQHAPLAAIHSPAGLVYRLETEPVAPGVSPPRAPLAAPPRAVGAGEPRGRKGREEGSAREGGSGTARPRDALVVTADDPVTSAHALDDVVARSPLDPAGYLLRGALRLDLCDPHGAAEDAARATLLDRRAPFAHVLAAMAAQSAGDLVGARRHAQNASRLLRDAPDDAALPHAQGLSVGAARALCAALLRAPRTSL